MRKRCLRFKGRLGRLFLLSGELMGVGPFTRAEKQMKTEPFIDFAVKNCLAQCAQTEEPMSSLSDYITKLKDQGWDEPSIDKFRQAVVDALSESSA